MVYKNKIKQKKFSIIKISFTLIIILFFILRLIPLLYMCRYVHASGDDYGYGMLPHLAWLNSHSFVEVLKAAGATVREYYYGWQGTWASIFLFSLQPEVFSPDLYWIVPIIMIFLTVISTSLLLFYILVKKLEFPLTAYGIINSCLLLMMIQFVPSTKSAIFWYNGTAHYIIPYFFAVLAIYSFFKFIDTYSYKVWLVALFSMFMLGGANYLAALLAPIILCFLLIVYGKKRRKSFLLLIPLAVEMIGLGISMCAPGNFVRGGEELSLTFSKLVSTIIKSFEQGFITIIEYIKDKPVVFIIMLFMVIVVWESLISKPLNFKYPYPCIFVVAMFCVYCAMFAPVIYAGTEVSGGVPNTIFQVFLLTVTADIVYVLGWGRRKSKERSEKTGKRAFYLEPVKFRRIVSIPSIIVCVIFVFFCRGNLRDMTMFKCIDYVVSGQADDYKLQMEERLSLLLDPSLREVELPEINQEQGPLMHMEVLADPNAWTNQVVGQFYQKDKVVGVKRK